ncbi:MAG: M15 family metallopeptidase [Eubacteriales bacterium]|nr:M15 family metallopeptidase [Eubacteriales bacterium]MDD3199676.1 M15 family metallopeptidase [Eubacteriales bacterium]MDD4121346.1 M15 family metallopeptidase [Eubacteriales bacterium]MDD4629817.1 M15 family metallopeptidase [Eubacteriales bacterium]
MTNENKLKATIIILLIAIEIVVWTVNHPHTPNVLSGINGGDENVPEMQNPGMLEGRDSIGNKDEASEYDGSRERLFKNAEQKGLLILVNKENAIPEDYKPDDLKAIKYFVKDRSAGSRYMRAEATDAFHKMVEKAAEENIEIRMTTAYRSYDFQKLLYENYVANEGQEAADTFSAKPGQSEHQTGLAADVSSLSVDYELSDDYGNMAEGKWLAENADQFGFIIRFPKGKEHITGYRYEPWHIRYVGIPAAKEIREHDLTLEEFLQQNDIRP